MTQDFWNKFFKERDHTGRELVVSYRTGKRYAIEPIGPDRQADWGTYNEQPRGSISEKDSKITKENGFINITILNAGVSPGSHIEKLDSQYPTL